MHFLGGIRNIQLVNFAQINVQCRYLVRNEQQNTQKIREFAEHSVEMPTQCAKLYPYSRSTLGLWDDLHGVQGVPEEDHVHPLLGLPG